MRYKIITYGCQMNVHESEKVAGILEQIGYSCTEEEQNADVIVFNTCCIRDTAEKRALGNIGALKQLKRQRRDLIIAVIGCITQQEGVAESLKKKFPFVDIILGTSNIEEIGDAIQNIRNYKSVIRVVDSTVNADKLVPIVRTSYPNAWINIMYGCNNFCTYCIVPHVRGRERSRKRQDILDDINKVLDSGYKEITLLGQNVDSFGSDLGNSYNFADLLSDIAKINGKFRIRFMTSHPKDFDKEVVDVIASSDNICKNIHLPIQSGSNSVLKAMNRHYTRENYLDIIDYIRRQLPTAGVTTDIMVGFPNETESDFEDTISLVKEVKFSSAFTFVFSPRKGTPAALMPQIDSAIKKERIQTLVALQNNISKNISESYHNKVHEILVESVNQKYKNSVCGRTDCGRLVTFEGGIELIGTFQNVLVTKSRSASLFGKGVDDGN